METSAMTRRFGMSLLATAVVTASWIAPAIAAPTPAVAAAAASAQPAEYRVSYGDALTIYVVGQPTLSVTDLAIRPDGRITLPLVQDLPVQGKTVPEVTALVTKSFKPFLASPQVMVNIARFRPVKITALGQVKLPGTFAFEATPNLVDVIAKAGGLTERASRTSVKVIDPKGTVTMYDIDQVLTGKQTLPAIAEGTVVEVGEVWGPDWYRVLPVIASVITAGAFLMREW